VAPQIPSIAGKHGVNILAGPFASREHTVVVIVETESAEALDTFLLSCQRAASSPSRTREVPWPSA